MVKAYRKERNKERLADEAQENLGGGISQCILQGFMQMLEYGCRLTLLSLTCALAHPPLADRKAPDCCKDVCTTFLTPINGSEQVRP